MTTETTPTSAAPLPAGTWQVDSGKSTLTFKARGMFGLVPVKGAFSDYNGTLTIDDSGAHGVLTVTAASLDTGNAKRDTHLRSEDFFDASNSPTFTFTLKSISPASDGTASASGVLQIRETKLEVTGPLTIDHIDGDRLRLSTSVSVDRDAAGVGWSKMGMIKGQAHLAAAVELVRTSAT
jgi:polyisoprenoid-binding protein YceI